MTTVIDYATTNLTQILAGLNVLSFLLGLLAAMIIYKPKLAAMKRYCEEVVKDKMAEKLRGIEGLLSRGGRPETREAKRIPVKDDDIEHLYSLIAITGDLGKWKTWTFLARQYPETVTGSWEINTNNILKPVLVLHVPVTEEKPVDQSTKPG